MIPQILTDYGNPFWISEICFLQTGIVMARNSAGSDDAIHTDRNARAPDHAISDSVPHENKNTEFEALLKLGSQELTDANANLLKNPIHPIFQKQRWRKSAQDAWLPLQPALSLASKAIGEDEMVAFWYHLVWGR
ncbi:hypothetical protein HO173_007662 [Letharia columbiana]|uniref:Uncharacterized protein n=1 Tax=Letharia columbiana TaxID=112416 RepID=A0A8H6L3K4_9LECA|nr:uncharacterized protein HO173_007662 [Letharia columbiana]KAF6234242.1 hypothetical protein HO173_007662 [Letharia columbiana]